MGQRACRSHFLGARNFDDLLSGRRFPVRITTSGRISRRPSLRLHDLRHSSATLQLSQGVPVHVVAGRLGHASPSITLSIYAAYLPSTDKLVADVVGAVLTSLNGCEMGANLGELTETTHSITDTQSNEISRNTPRRTHSDPAYRT